MDKLKETKKEWLKSDFTSLEEYILSKHKSYEEFADYCKIPKDEINDKIMELFD